MEAEELAAQIQDNWDRGTARRDLEARDAFVRGFKLAGEPFSDDDKDCFRRGWEMGEQFVAEFGTRTTLATAWRIRENGGDAGIFEGLSDDMREFFERHDVGMGFPEMLWWRYQEYNGPDFRVSDETERRVSCVCYGLIYRAARYFDEIRRLEAREKAPDEHDQRRVLTDDEFKAFGVPNGLTPLTFTIGDTISVTDENDRRGGGAFWAFGSLTMNSLESNQGGGIRVLVDNPDYLGDENRLVTYWKRDVFNFQPPGHALNVTFDSSDVIDHGPISGDGGVATAGALMYRVLSVNVVSEASS